MQGPKVIVGGLELLVFMNLEEAADGIELKVIVTEDAITNHRYWLWIGTILLGHRWNANHLRSDLP